MEEIYGQKSPDREIHIVDNPLSQRNSSKSKLKLGYQSPVGRRGIARQPSLSSVTPLPLNAQNDRSSLEVLYESFYNLQIFQSCKDLALPFCEDEDQKLLIKELEGRNNELEDRNNELKTQIEVIKSAADKKITTLEDSFQHSNQECHTLKEQLEETICAADKCIAELEEQVRRFLEEKTANHIGNEKHISDLTERINILNSEKLIAKNASDKMISELESMIKTNNVEYSSQIAGLHASNVVYERKLSEFDDEIKKKNEDISMCKKKFDDFLKVSN